MSSVRYTDKPVAEVFSATDIKAMSPTAQRFAKILEREGWISISGGEKR